MHIFRMPSTSNDVKRLSLDRTEIAMQLVIEPVQETRTLLLFWEPVGYIPAIKLKKTMDALTKKEVRDIKFKCIEWKYIYGLGEFRYVASIMVTKVNRWLATDKDYEYNDML